MKLKLLAVSIFAILSFVAYQKYQEISTLKSVDSYESCIVTKGSTIQESYPSICITRLGSRFIEKTISDTYSDDKYQIQIPSSWKMDNYQGIGMRAHSLTNSGTTVELIRNSPFDYTNKFECFNKTSSNWIKQNGITLIQYDYRGVEQVGGQCQNSSEFRLKIILLAKDSSKNENIYDYLLFRFPESAKLSSEADFAYILSTFKFTD
jgi:hypothetical protein